MKNKGLIICATIIATILLVAITVYGANELKISGTNTAALTANTASKPIAWSQANNLPSESQESIISNGIQEIKTELSPFAYPALTVQKGVPVKWVINAEAQNLNSCNNEIVIPAYGISKELKVGENVIEFTPEETGIIQYSCWMGMINSTIAVVEDINNVDAAAIQDQINQLPRRGGCCG